MIINKPELLSPAGNIQKANFAVKFGADAIYIGTNQFGLRYNKNFADLKEIKKISELIHEKNKKIYLTTNIFMHNTDIKSFEKNFNKIIETNPDALIVSDLGALSFLLSKRSKINNNDSFEIHISTQANTTNFLSVKFYSSLGVDRIILARELTLIEIFEIKKILQKNNLKIKIETFVHGAMCISYSGRCLLSLYMTSPETSSHDLGKLYHDANRGLCTHPCRWEYKIVEKKRNDEIFEVIEDNNYTYFMSSKDLNLLKYIPILIISGIDSFKIEGRMKSNHYLSAATLAYRYAIDYSFSLLNSTFPFKSNKIKRNDPVQNEKNNYDSDNNETIDIDIETAARYIKNPDLFFNDFPKWISFYKDIYKILENFSHRPYTTGFYFIKSRKDISLSATKNKYIENLKYIGFTLYCFKFNSFNSTIANNNLSLNHHYTSFLNILNNLKLNISNKEKEIIYYILQHNQYPNIDKNFFKHNSLKSFKLIIQNKFLNIFYSKNKFDTKNDLYILNSKICYPDNKKIIPYLILKPDKFAIYNLNFEKIDYTKHSNFYLLLTDENIGELSILLCNK